MYVYIHSIAVMIVIEHWLVPLTVDMPYDHVHICNVFSTKKTPAIKSSVIFQAKQYNVYVHRSMISILWRSSMVYYK